MSAIRFAARRLAGLRAPAFFGPVVSPAVAAEQRRVLPALAHAGSPVLPAYSRRFISSSETYSRRLNFEHPCAKPPPGIDEKDRQIFNQFYQIDQKAEELFYLLANLENKSRSVPWHVKLRVKKAREYSRLLRHLFRTIEKNPDDPLWCWYRERRIITNAAIYSMPTLLLGSFVYDWEVWKNVLRYLLE